MDRPQHAGGKYLQAAKRLELLGTAGAKIVQHRRKVRVAVRHSSWVAGSVGTAVRICSASRSQFSANMRKISRASGLAALARISQSVDVFALRARGGGRFSDACALRACLRCDLPSKVRGLRIRRRRSGAEVAEPVARMRPRVLRLRDVAGAGASIPMRRRAQDRDGPWRTRSGWDSPR